MCLCVGKRKKREEWHETKKIVRTTTTYNLPELLRYHLPETFLFLFTKHYWVEKRRKRREKGGEEEVVVCETHKYPINIFITFIDVYDTLRGVERGTHS